MGKKIAVLFVCVVVGVVLAQLVNFVLSILFGFRLVGLEAGVLGIVTTFLSMYFVGLRVFGVNYFEDKKRKNKRN
jgi:hypothetical protein